MSFAAKRKKNYQNLDKQTPHTVLQKLSPKSTHLPLKVNYVEIGEGGSSKCNTSMRRLSRVPSRKNAASGEPVSEALAVQNKCFAFYPHKEWNGMEYRI